MKYSKLTPIIAFFMLAVLTVPAYAFDIGLTGNLNVKAQDSQDQNSDEHDKSSDSSVVRQKDDKSSHDSAGLSSQIKAWAISAGTIGQVTAVASGSLTVKTAAGDIYTVTTADATIRRGENSTTPSPIVVGDTVYVFGVKNGSTIVASMIIVGKTKNEVKPTAEEKRQAYLGVVTAKTDSSITISNANSVAYTVNLTSNAQIWINKAKQSNLSGFAVGDNVMVQGSLSGSTITASKVVAVHLPVGTVVGKITAVSGTTLTVMGSDNKVYTVLAANAVIKAKGNNDEDKSSQLSALSVGDVVLVKGDLSGTTITAQSVTEEKVKGDFFHRFGLFFKNIFGKK